MLGMLLPPIPMSLFSHQIHRTIEFPTYLGAKYDASTTNLTYRIDAETSTAAPVEITVSFLSPITPTSTLRQSIPASYITIHVNGGVGVDVYMDVNGRWVTGDAGAKINWQYDTIDAADRKRTLQQWKLQRESQLLLSETRDRAEWGSLHFTGPYVCCRLGSYNHTPLTAHPGCPIPIRRGCSRKTDICKARSPSR